MAVSVLKMSLVCQEVLYDKLTRPTCTVFGKNTLILVFMVYVVSFLCSQQGLVEECYREWNHPICQNYLALRQVSDVINGKRTVYRGSQYMLTSL